HAGSLDRTHRRRRVREFGRIAPRLAHGRSGDGEERSHGHDFQSHESLPANHRHPLQPSTRVHSASLDAQRIRSGTLEKEAMKTRKLTFEQLTFEQVPATFDGLIKLHAP